MTTPPLIMPALRGAFGDWVYYSCLMPLSELADRVNYAEEIHRDQALSQLIQRSLEGARARHIAEYLDGTPQRFFNSLVLATYGGKPEWLEVGNFKSSTRSDLLEHISSEALDSLGFLSFTGSERIFALDGQHRLAGIKRALASGADIGAERVPVLLVGHKRTDAGLKRTRRLFTTLNKAAVPVRKRDIIALDEDDAMAVTVRRLVETNPCFRDPRIAVISSQNIPTTDRTCLTTISNLYDILKILFLSDIKQRSDLSLRFNRPSDEKLEHFYDVATKFFHALSETFDAVGKFFAARNPQDVTRLQRTPLGGHLLFRPIGLEIVTRVAVELAAHHRVGVPAAVRMLGRLPIEIEDRPYAHVTWQPVRGVVLTRGKRLARDLVRHMVGLEVDVPKLRSEYGVALGRDEPERVRLPARVV